MSDTYTEAELQARVDKAVAAATAESDAKVRELTAAASTSEAEAARVAVETKHAEEVAELQRQLDEKVLEAATATKEYGDFKTGIEALVAAEEATKAIEARKAGRLTAVKEAAPNFPDDYLAANADRFAAMPDEAFELAIESFKAQAALSTTGTSTTTIPVQTALHAGRETETTSSTMSPTKAIFDLRRNGVRDLSTL